jgi:hypothetical protein
MKEFGHSHGYEMRLQKARELEREESDRKREIREKERAISAHRDRLHELHEALRMIAHLPAILARYEETGDHNHGKGPLSPGAPCPGGDCLVAKARALIALGITR